MNKTGLNGVTLASCYSGAAESEKHVKNAIADCPGDRPDPIGIPRRECGAQNAALVLPIIPSDVVGMVDFEFH